MAELTPKTISELPNASSISNSDLLALMAGSASKRLSIENLRKLLPNLGTNPTGGTTNDTRAFWLSLGTGIAYISGAGQVYNQPNNYGFIINIAYGTNVRQLWLTQPNGTVANRGANTSTDFDSVSWDVLMGAIEYTPTVKEYSFSNATINANGQMYAYSPNLSGYRCISAYCSFASSVTSANAVVILSNPVYVAASSQWTARLFNPNDYAVTVTGSVFFVFVKARDLDFS